jgi:hypothetical protein
MCIGFDHAQLHHSSFFHSPFLLFSISILVFGALTRNVHLAPIVERLCVKLENKESEGHHRKLLKIFLLEGLHLKKETVSAHKDCVCILFCGFLPTNFHATFHDK